MFISILTFFSNFGQCIPWPSICTALADLSLFWISRHMFMPFFSLSSSFMPFLIIKNIFSNRNIGHGSDSRFSVWLTFEPYINEMIFEVLKDENKHVYSIRIAKLCLSMNVMTTSEWNIIFEFNRLEKDL